MLVGCQPGSQTATKLIHRTQGVDACAKGPDLSVKTEMWYKKTGLMQSQWQFCKASVHFSLWISPCGHNSSCSKCMAILKSKQRSDELLVMLNAEFG
jgi:hypothetical protein